VSNEPTARRVSLNERTPNARIGPASVVRFDASHTRVMEIGDLHQRYERTVQDGRSRTGNARNATGDEYRRAMPGVENGDRA